MRVLSLSSRFACLAALALLAVSAPVAGQDATITIKPVIEGAFDQPMHVTNAGDDRLFVIERPGIVMVLPGGTSASPEPFLDITDRVGSEGAEQGLLGIAFPPTSHGESTVYLSYTDLDGHSVVSRFEVAPDGLTADPASETVVLTQDQPFPNHNGGYITFGPDDMLYIGLGDGGSQGDPDDNAQDLSTWLGKILRIDVNPASLGSNEAYAVPDDNPFVDDPEAAPEVWALGLQNPRHIAFDATGELIAISDVGKITQEVDILPVSEASGANFGWSVEEGGFCTGPGICDTEGMIDQTRSYDDLEGCAIAGGAFIGEDFLYADRCTGKLWLVTEDDGGRWSLAGDAETGLSISSVGASNDGTILVTDPESGSVYRVLIA